MAELIKNPFSITKATEFTNQEILDYWIDYNPLGTDSIFAKLNPQELMPKYILGGKGCGKTHILRYYSFKIRKLKYANNFEEMLLTDKYVGIYSRLDSLNSSRFSGKGISEDIWSTMYEYYFELSLGIQMLQVYEDIFNHIKVSEKIVSSIIRSIETLLHGDARFNSLNDVAVYLNNKKAQINNQIVNVAYTRKLDVNSVKSVFGYGDLIFEVPAIIEKLVPQLDNVHIIYILDEYEKLFEWQKESLNHLVYEKKHNCTFWIGARRYGYTTRKTKTGEEIVEGSEYQPILLDELMRSDEKSFKQFALSLFDKRISNEGYDNALRRTIFEDYDEDVLIESLSLKSVNSPRGLIHIKKLRESLQAINMKDEYIENIITGIIYQANGGTNVLYQKYKCFLFYQEWSKLDPKKDNVADNLLKAVKEINKEFDQYLCSHKSKFDNIDDKFKRDLLAQLAIENGERYYMHSGIDEIITISHGNPRVFLVLLKLIVEYSIFRGEQPFISDQKISVESQYLGIKDAANWFIKDAEVSGKDGKDLLRIVNALVQFFYVQRYCDKPTETSPCSFYYKSSNETPLIRRKIEELVAHSFIIEVDSRKDKNLGVPEKAYQLNKTIATLYNLPTARRGIIHINEPLLSIVMLKENSKEFDKTLKSIKQRLNAPFKIKAIENMDDAFKQPTLF